jgi:hypothetical protein
MRIDMTETLCIKPLRCGHCGRELPVMGQLVTFQCPECSRYWVLANESIEPISVFRASPAGESAHDPEGPCVYLPFWVVDVEGAGLKNQIVEAFGEIRGVARTVIRTGFGGVEVKRSPASAEIEHLASRIESLGTFKVYVPAFKSLNTYAYLKVGRLLTRTQPSFSLERSDGAGHPILCALRAEEAVALIDFIFFATLPESIREDGDFLEKIFLSPARPPRLVEFPFRERGASLVSVIGGFWISGRLVEGVESLVE